MRAQRQRAGGAHTLLVSRDVCGATAGATKVRALSGGGTVRVFDKAAVDTAPATPEALRASPRGTFGFLAALAFRFVLEVNDTCTNNILLSGSSGDVWSVDEGSALSGPRKLLLKKKVHAALGVVIVPAVETHWSALRALMLSWEEKLASAAGAALFERHGFGHLRARVREHVAQLQVRENWVKALTG